MIDAQIIVAGILGMEGRTDKRRGVISGPAQSGGPSSPDAAGSKGRYPEIVGPRGPSKHWRIGGYRLANQPPQPRKSLVV